MSVIFNPENNTEISRRMMNLTESFFDTKIDESQIPINLESRNKFFALSPYTFAVEVIDNNPIAWVLTMPTHKEIARDFIDGKITEKELFDRTKPGGKYDAVYLASSFTVPEHRRKGFAKRLRKIALGKFFEIYPIEMVFAWPYSEEGKALDKALEKEIGRPIVFKA